MADMTVANTILAQLGGRRFKVMTGASSFCGSENSLSFRIPQVHNARTGKSIAGVRIELTPADVYRMVFIGKTGPNFGDIGEVDVREDIYCDQLQEVFTRVTGLYTHL